MQRRLCPPSLPSISFRSDRRCAVRAASRRHGRRAAAPRRPQPPAPHSPAPSPSAAPAQATRQAPLLLPRGCQRCAHHEECCKRGDSELHIAVLCRDLRRQPLHARRACWRLAQAQPPAAVVLRDEAVVMDVEGQRRPAHVPAACPAPAPLALSAQLRFRALHFLKVSQLSQTSILLLLGRCQPVGGKVGGRGRLAAHGTPARWARRSPAARAPPPPPCAAASARERGRGPGRRKGRCARRCCQRGRGGPASSSWLQPARAASAVRSGKD